MEEGNTIDFSTGGVCLSSSSSFFIGGGGWGENFFEEMILRLVLPTGWDIPLTLKEYIYMYLEEREEIGRERRFREIY